MWIKPFSETSLWRLSHDRTIITRRKLISFMLNVNCLICWQTRITSGVSLLYGNPISHSNSGIRYEDKWPMRYAVRIKNTATIFCISEISYYQVWISSSSWFSVIFTWLFFHNDNLMITVQFLYCVVWLGGIAQSIQWLGYGLDNWSSVSSRSMDLFSFRYCVQTGSGAQQVSYPTGTGDKAAEVWRWLLVSI